MRKWQVWDLGYGETETGKAAACQYGFKCCNDRRYYRDFEWRDVNYLDPGDDDLGNVSSSGG